MAMGEGEGKAWRRRGFRTIGDTRKKKQRAEEEKISGYRHHKHGRVVGEEERRHEERKANRGGGTVGVGEEWCEKKRIGGVGEVNGWGEIGKRGRRGGS